MDSIFLLGIFCLPFENFFFAPSAGWAAITPVIFVPYLIFNRQYWGRCLGKYRKLFYLVFYGLLITCVNYFWIDNYIAQALSRLISTVISLGLGFVSLFCFDIYFIQKKRSMERVERILLVSYGIALLIGFVQFLAIRLDLRFVKEIFEWLFKRNYINVNRVQYFFTEPSFIGMHLFGVLLPVYVYGKNKKIRNLIIIFALSSILFGCGVRVVLDILIAVIVLLLFRIDFSKLKNILIVFTVILTLGVSLPYVYKRDVRIQRIISEGVYADGSFASRWFRVNASLKGYQKNPKHMLVGYGFGNELYPLKEGYKDARQEYASSYLQEVIALENAEQRGDESVTFCFYIRIISELGIVVFLILARGVFRWYRKNKDKQWKAVFIIILYLYVQFEPYAFYAIWLFWVLNQAKQEKLQKEVLYEER